MFAKRQCRFRSLCWVMAIVTPLAPSASLYAQTVAAAKSPAAAQYLVPNAAAVVSLRPHQILTCETAQMWPVEVITAASLKELGFDPVKIERVLFSASAALAGPPQYAVVIELTERIDLATLSPQLTQHTQRADLNGQAYLQSQHPVLPSLYWTGEKTLLLAPQQLLEQLLGAKDRPNETLVAELAQIDGEDLLVLVNLLTLRPLIQMGLMQASSKMQSEMLGLLEIPNLIDQVRMRVNLSGAGPLELSCVATDAKSAGRITEILQQLIDFYGQQATAQATELLASDDPVEQAMGRYINRVMPAATEEFMPAQSGNRFTIFHIAAEENPFGGTASVATIGVLVGLLLPAVQAAREAARRNASMNNMKQLMLGMFNYESAHGRFPAHANYDENGKPLLSWRVHLLPYLEENALYKQFHLNEPWDSPHNKKLIAQMPSVFLDPSSKLNLEGGRTHYLAAEGKRFAFDGTQQGRQLRSFLDGTSNTISLLQVNDEATVAWTKPQDWKMNSNNKLQGLVPTLHPGVFQAGFSDGSVQNISATIDLDVFERLLTVDGDDEVIDGF